MHWNFKIQGDSNQPIVLFLHGFLGDCEDFAAVIAELSKQFCCLSLDLPGHGKTRGTVDYTMQNTAQAIVALLDDLKIFQANLVGYSMGGRLGLYLALHYPTRFPKAAIESASPGLKTEAARSQRLQNDEALAERLAADFDRFLAEWYEQPLFRSLKNHPTFEQMLENRARNNPVELAKSLRQMSTGRQPNLWQQLETHQNPLLLMVGERDRKFVEMNQEMAAICDMATLAIVPDAGHNIHLEQPEAFVSQLCEFLD